MKNKKRNYVVIGLVVLLLALAIGYAAFSDTLTISGSANANGKFDMAFVQEGTDIDRDTAKGINVDGSSAEVTGGNDLYVIVRDLSYPGAGTKINAVVENKGTVAAKLNTPEIAWNAEQEAIVVEFPEDLEGTVVEPGEKQTITFTVKWIESYTEPVNKSAQFTVKLNYEQNMDA